MISRNSLIDLANNITSHLIPDGDDSKEVANNTLKQLYKNCVIQLAFINSTGRTPEYSAWITRFHKCHPGLDKMIMQNMELEEEKFSLCVNCKNLENKFCNKLKRNVPDDFGCVYHEASNG